MVLQLKVLAIKLDGFSSGPDILIGKEKHSASCPLTSIHIQ